MSQNTLPGMSPEEIAPTLDEAVSTEEHISSLEIISRLPPDVSATHHGRHPPPPPRWRRIQSRSSRPLAVDGKPELVRDLMTRQILTIGPDDTLENLEEYMEGFHFRHLPVVEGDRLVGLITRSDLHQLSSSKLSKSAPEENYFLHRLPAARIMQREVITVRPDEPLVNVAALMWETRVGCLPVTEIDGTLVGILTEGDFVRLAHDFLMRGRDS
jgi:CBS domain-containing protein